MIMDVNLGGFDEQRHNVNKISNLLTRRTDVLMLHFVSVAVYFE